MINAWSDTVPQYSHDILSARWHKWSTPEVILYRSTRTIFRPLDGTSDKRLKWYCTAILEVFRPLHMLICEPRSVRAWTEDYRPAVHACTMHIAQCTTHVRLTSPARWFIQGTGRHGASATLSAIITRVVNVMVAPRPPPIIAASRGLGVFTINQHAACTLHTILWRVESGLYEPCFLEHFGFVFVFIQLFMVLGGEWLRCRWVDKAFEGADSVWCLLFTVWPHPEQQVF